MFYRIGICDDDNFFLEQAEEILHKYEKSKGFTFDIHTYSSGEELLDHYKLHHFHVLLLDMEMNGLNGIQVAEKIRESDTDVSLIYITTHDNFALDAFNVDAESYLVKPFSPRKLFTILDRVFQKLMLQLSFLEYEKNYISLGTGEDIFQLSFDAIIYISKYRNHMIFHTKKQEHHVYMNLKDIIQKLDISVFVQINKGQIINWQKVTYVKDNIIVAGDIELQISRSHVKKLNTRFQTELEHLLRIRASECLETNPIAPFHMAVIKH